MRKFHVILQMKFHFVFTWVFRLVSSLGCIFVCEAREWSFIFTKIPTLPAALLIKATVHSELLSSGPCSGVQMCVGLFLSSLFCSFGQKQDDARLVWLSG